MGICLPQRLAELFPDDDEEPRLPRTAAKETYNRQMTDSNIDPGINFFLLFIFSCMYAFSNI